MLTIVITILIYSSWYDNIINNIYYSSSKIEEIDKIIDTMKKDTLSLHANLELLKQDLTRHYKNTKFLNCKSMGEVVELSLKLVLVH
jgi:hypothetical protein